MQIVRTDIDRITAPTGEAVLRVRFCGEGGDCVTVEMAGTRSGDDGAALDRARAILVQTATFDLAANDYEAESNGNFDEFAVTAAHEERDAIYIFEYRDGEGTRQTPPSSMPSFAAAREEAIRGAIDLLADLSPGTDDPSGWLVRVRDESGELLCVIDVQEAEAARQMKTMIRKRLEAGRMEHAGRHCGGWPCPRRGSAVIGMRI